MYPGSCTNEYGVSITGTVSTSTCDAWREADPFIEPGLREAILAAHDEDMRELILEVLQEAGVDAARRAYT